MTRPDTFTSTVEDAALYERWNYDVTDDGPSPAEYMDPPEDWCEDCAVDGHEPGTPECPLEAA